MASDLNSHPDPDDVVISGIGGIFPLSDNMDELETNLFNNVNMIQKIENPNGFTGDLDLPCRQGTIPDKYAFDDTFFKVSSIQASNMDILIWKILEKTFEAIVDSGHNPNDLSGTNTAVLMGSNISESEMTYLTATWNTGVFVISGHCRAMLANRVSYWLNTKGPSYGYYSDQIAGIYGLTQALELINTNQCDSAIVGSIDIMSCPELLYHFKCLEKSRANNEHTEEHEGIRGEGGVVLYLQKARHAKRIYATVIHSDQKCYGDRNAGFVRPMSDNMLELLQKFYEKCRIDPDDINYLETSSCLNTVFNNDEFEAINKALLSKRKSPLLTGCVKTSIGNTGSSSNFCSIAKILIAMERGVIPANYQHSSSALRIPTLAEGMIQVVNQNTKWDVKYAAINAMDIAGNVGHVLVRANSKQKPLSSNCDDGIPRLICVSGRTEEGIKKTIDKITSIPTDVEFARLVQDIHSTNITNHNYRGYVITSSVIESQEIQHFDGAKRPVWFVFSGMGSQWPGMATHLMKLPVIAETLQQCHRILLPKGVDLINILTSHNSDIFDNILHSFVGIAAVQVALVEMLRQLKIEPDGIIGHSVGELGCAYADGCFTMEQIMLASYYRGLASLETDLIEGRMAAVGVGYKKLKYKVPPSVDVACHNSEDSSTISGPKDDIIRFVGQLKSEYIFAREVNVSNIAYHSRYIRPAAPKLLACLKQIIPDPKLRSSRWHSTSVPEELWATDEAKYSSAEYYTNNLLNPVLFEETSRHIPTNAVLIEIAPHGQLQAILKRSMAADCIKIPLTQRRHQHGLEFLLSAIGKCYLAGSVPLISNLYPSVQFPVSRGTPFVSSIVSWDHSKTWPQSQLHSEKQRNLMLYSVKIHLNEENCISFQDYRVNGRIILPISAVLVLIWEVAENSHLRIIKKKPVMFEKVVLGYILAFPESDSVHLTISLGLASGYFEVTEEGKKEIFVKGYLSQPEDIAIQLSSEAVPATEHYEEITCDEFYEELKNNGYEFGEELKTIRKIVLNDKGSKSLMDFKEDWIVSIDSLLQVAIFHLNEGKEKWQFPSFIQKVIINPSETIYQNEYVAVFNKFHSSVRCDRIEVSGIKMEKFLLERRSKVIRHIVRFAPYIKAHSQDSKEFVDQAVQLLLENVHSSAVNTLTMTELAQGIISKLNAEVKNILSRDHNEKVFVNTVYVDEVEDLKGSELGDILLADECTVEPALSVLRNRGGFLLAILHYDTAALELDQHVAIIAENCFGNRRWILLKKCVPVNKRTPVMYLPQFQFCTMEDIIHEYSSNIYYLVADLNTFDEVKSLLTFLNEEKEQHHRLIIVMDNDAPQFSLSNPLFSEQLKLDVVVNIYYNGTWGFLRQFEVPSVPPGAHNYLKILETPLKQEDIHWSYIGINNHEILSGDKESIDTGVVDLSGYTSDGQRVMCVGRVKPGTVHMSTEPHMSWSIPDTWSLEDAATIPYAYSLAYYSLAVKAHYPKSSSILILSGQSYMGQAFIAVALELGLKVCTTVSTKKHREHLVKKFPQIQDTFISDAASTNFDKIILEARNNKGFSVVVNFHDQPDLQKSVNLLCFYGCVLLFSKTQMKQYREFGLNSFLKGIAVYGITPEFILELDTAWKRNVRDLMMQGITAGIVQPLDKEVFSISMEQEICRTLHDSDFSRKVVITIHKNSGTHARDVLPLQQRGHDRNVTVAHWNKYCLVVGDKQEDCVILTEWLVNRGVQKLALCCGDSGTSSLTRRRLWLLRNQHRAHITVVPLEMTCVLNAAMKPWDDNNGFTLLTDVFILPVEKPQLVTSLLQTLDDTASVYNLVQLMNNSAHNVVNTRRSRGLPVLNVQWESLQKTVSLHHVLEHLEDLLARVFTETVYLSVEDNYRTVRKSLSGYQLPLLLPFSIKMLEELGDDLMHCKVCSLVEVCTKSPRMLYVREVHPVYIIPGLQRPAKITAEVLARNLMCPAVIIQLQGGADNLKENVSVIVKDMMQLQGGGIYNIVGISWGGMYAFELAKQLQALGESTNVIFVDGVPQTNQDILRYLGKGSQLEVNLLTLLLKLDSTKMHEDLLALPDWNYRLRVALTEFPTASTTNLRMAIESVYMKINTLLSYSPDKTMVLGPVSLIHPKDSDIHKCDLIKMFKESPNIRLVEGNHETILENPETALIISEAISVDLQWKRN